MKNIWMLILTVMAISAWGSPVKNKDLPLRGEWDFQPQKLWEISQLGDNLLVGARNIQIDDGGNIYFFDAKQAKVFALDSNGKVLFSRGSKGEGPGEFNDMYTLMFLTDQNILVYECNRNLLHYFSKKGEFIKCERTIKTEYAQSVAHFVSPDRFLFNLKKEKDQSTILGLFTIGISKISELAKIPGKADLKVGGNTTIDDPRLFPGVVTAGSKNYLVYGSTDRYEINRMDWQGKNKLAFSIEGRKKQAISREIKEKLYGKFPLGKEVIKELISGSPDQANYFFKLQVFDRGLIFVFAPVFDETIAFGLDIFSGSGQYLYQATIKFPDKIKVNSSCFVPGQLLVAAETAEGELKLIKYKINFPPAK